MKAKYVFLIFILLAALQQAYSQKYEADIAIGYSSYATTDLKRLQDEITLDNSFSFKATDRFPSQPYLQLTIAKKMNDGNRIGLFWGYLSTGGRITVSDYSGEILYDQILMNHELGMNLNLYLTELKSEKGAPFVQIKISALLSRLELNESVYLSSGENFEDKLTLIAQNVAITPSIGFETQIMRFPIRVAAGYLMQVTEFPFHLRENRDAKLRISGDNTVGPGLTGLRIGISSVLPF